MYLEQSHALWISAFVATMARGGSHLSLTCQTMFLWRVAISSQDLAQPYEDWETGRDTQLHGRC